MKWIWGLPVLFAFAQVQAQPTTGVVRLHGQVSMAQLAQSVLDPASPRYQKYYTPEEIRALAAPTDEQYANVLNQLRREGFQITGESKTHLWISVKGEPATFERTFQTHLVQKSAHTFAKLGEVRVPTYMSLIETVSGLDSTRQSHPKFVRAQANDGSDVGLSQTIIKDGYGLTPLYKSGLSGKGQHIAIATYEGFHIDNIRTAYQLLKLSPGPTVDEVEFNGTPAYTGDGSNMETELDAEFSGMIAPGASVHVFASAENSDAGELQMFTAILDDNRSKIVNYSWGGCEGQVSQDHVTEMTQVFDRAVAQGVNILAASGDSGSDSCQDGSTAADWPAAHNDIVAVGGTSFRTSGSSSGAASESAWSGSGGGISGVFALPSWQNAIGSQFTKRSYPDVAFNADPATGQAVYTDDWWSGQADWQVVGGTSMAAPQWAGFLAMVEEARANNGMAPLGPLNPRLYGMDDATRASSMSDVTSGSNGAYSAAKGWDAVTGWGSMKGQALLNALIQN